MEGINIIVPRGTTKKRKIIGRGGGSGHGGTSCRGSKGQNSRSGGGVRPGFEGGQMPLFRRIARRGFSNIRFKKEFSIVNIKDLVNFEDGTRITRDILLENRIIKKKGLPVRLLGNGEITKKLIIDLGHVSKSAQEKIIKAGGEIIANTKIEVEDNG